MPNRPPAPTFAIPIAIAIAIAPISSNAQDLVVSRWLVRGPIPADRDSAGVLRDYIGGEPQLLPAGGDSTAGGPWLTATSDSIGRLDLNTVFGVGTDWSAAYAHTYVHAPEDRTVLLVMDSDDDLVAHVNGQRIWVNVVPRGLGRGSDTVTVRLARGWNSVLLKVINRTGGFGVLGRLAQFKGPDDLSDLRFAIDRPKELAFHNLPEPTITIGPIQLRDRLTWRLDQLVTDADIPVIAWGPQPLTQPSVQMTQGDRTLLARHLADLSPGEPTLLTLSSDFSALQAAALGGQTITASAAWSDGGYVGSPLFVGAERLLRLFGGRIKIEADIDSVAGQPNRLSAELVVPEAFDGLTVDLLTLGLGPNAHYRINGNEVEWTEGSVELCAACRFGDRLSIEIELDRSRPLWMMPVARVREIGYAEYADGFDYAKLLAGREPDIERPDASQWLRVLGGERSVEYRALLDRYRDAYAAGASHIRRDTLYLIGNSHIDAAWLWPWSETIDVIRNTWRTSLKLGEIFPGYIFAGSATAYYDMLDRLEPALADSIRAATRTGMWTPVGGWWVESDVNMPSGESLIRQGLYGQRYFEKSFGRRSRVAWTPDSFGYPWTLPQILQQTGFDYFVTQKIRWNDSTEFPHNAFYWEGVDGSRIFAYNPYGYVHNLNPQTLVEQRLEDRERTGGHSQIVLYGVGDHGGGPTIAMLQRAEDLRRIPTFPALRYSAPLEAMEAVSGEQPVAGFPVWRDELYLEYHRGVYTTQASMKRRNRRSEAMLQTAEALAAIDGAPYPRDRLESAWRRVLFNQFHDILPGSSIRVVYEDAEAWYDTAWASLDSLTATAFDRLRDRMDTRTSGGSAFVVFNPLAWPRSATLDFGSVPGEWQLFVENVPALGAAAIDLDEARAANEARTMPAPTAGPSWIENAYLRVEIDASTGDIVRIYDREVEREVLAPGGRGNVLQIFDDRPTQWDAWNIVLTGERWDVRDVREIVPRAQGGTASLQIDRAWGNSTFRQTLVLNRDSRMLDVLNEIDWRERRKLLKVAFQLNVAADSATYEIPYGTIGRSGDPQTQAERAKFEVPGQRWADVSQGDYGVGILNDGKYGWDYKGNVLRLSLLRAPIWPDSLADRGEHRFRFAVYPHAGDWRAAETGRRAAEYNVPLLYDAEPPHDGPLGSEYSFASASPANVNIEWLKRAEDSDARVLRLVEWHGQPADATIRVDCSVARARRANALEELGEDLETDGRRVRLNLRPYEIATLLVECDE